MNKGYIPYQLVCNAENFIEKAVTYGLKISSTPTLCGIMVWQKGSLSSGDGAGHVAVVERINPPVINKDAKTRRGILFFIILTSGSNTIH